MLTRRDFIRLSLFAGVGVLTGCGGAEPTAAPKPAATVAPSSSAPATAAPTAASSAIAFDKQIYWEADRRISEWLQGVKTASDPTLSPIITAPAVVEVASEVETTVAVPLAPTSERYIKRLILYDPESVVKVKFVATFSPKIQAANVSALVKMLRTSKLAAIAETNTGDKWWSESKAIQVGVGGCAVGQEPSRTVPSDALRVKFREDKDGFVRMDVRLHHPMLSGYSADTPDKVIKVFEPFYANRLTVVYAGETIADIELTPGLSENARISFAMRRLGNEPLTVTVFNNEGGKFSINVLIST